VPKHWGKQISLLPGNRSTRGKPFQELWKDLALLIAPLKGVGQWKESVPSVNVTSPTSGGRETLRANNYVCVWMDCTGSGSG